MDAGVAVEEVRRLLSLGPRSQELTRALSFYSLLP